MNYINELDWKFIKKIVDDNTLMYKTKISVEYFEDTLSKIIYSLIVQNINDKGVFIPLSDLKTLIKDTERLDKLKILNYPYEVTTIEDLINHIHTFKEENISFSAIEKTISERYLRKKMKDIAFKLESDTNNSTKSTSELLRKYTNSLDKLLYADQEDRVVLSMEDILKNEITYQNDETKQLFARTGTIIDLENGGLNSPSLTIIAGHAKNGKALSLNSKIFTPNGYILMKHIKIGDKIFGEKGDIYKVTDIPFRGLTDSYKIIFNDGNEIKCSGDHLWKIEDRKLKNKEYVLSTREIIEKGVRYREDNRIRFGLPNISNINFIKKDVLIDPYVLGVLLGDGCVTGKRVSITNGETDIVEKVKLKYNDVYVRYNNSKNAYDVNFHVGTKVRDQLKKYGLQGCYSKDKFIPEDYLYNDFNTRLEILQGLFDTDGSVEKKPHGGVSLIYYTTSPQLMYNVKFLVESFGGVVNVTTKRAKCNGKDYGICYYVTIAIDPSIQIFTSEKHLKRYVVRKKPISRAIESIEKIEDEEMQCISTSNPTKLFITDNFIVTHNSCSLYQIALTCLEEGRTVLFGTIEIPAEEAYRKILSSYIGIDYSVINKKELTGEDRDFYLDKVKEFTTKYKDKFFIYYKRSGFCCKDIEVYYNNLKKAGITIDDIVLDYLFILKSNEGSNLSIVETVGKLPTEMRILSQTTNTRVFSAVQLRNDSITTPIEDLNFDNIFYAKSVAYEATYTLIIKSIKGKKGEKDKFYSKCLASRNQWSDTIYEFKDINFSQVRLGEPSECLYQTSEEVKMSDQFIV